MSQRTAAVIVTYQPAPAALLRLIEVLAPQVRSIVIVDNASTDTACLDAVTARVDVIRRASNDGIAAALNEGLARVAAQGGSEFAILFDQDSAPSIDMVERMERYHDDLAARGPVLQLGPYFFERNRDCYLPFIEFRFGLARRKRAPGPDASWTTADYLITSGALIPLSAYAEVGPFDAALFIDYVDIEWGLRGRAKGWQSYGLFDVRMEHEIGEAALQLGAIKVAMHKPQRRYYYYRNALLLCARAYIPFAWKASEVVRLMVKFLIFAAFSPHRAADVRMMLRGIGDGLAGRTGKFPG